MFVNQRIEQRNPPGTPVAGKESIRFCGAFRAVHDKYLTGLVTSRTGVPLDGILKLTGLHRREFIEKGHDPYRGDKLHYHHVYYRY